MDQLLDKLVKLQDVLKDIYYYEKLNIQLPKNINIQRNHFDPRKEDLESRIKQLEEDKKELSGKDITKKTQEDKHNEINERMKMIKTQKEFNALSNEQDFIEMEINQFKTEMETLVDRISKAEEEINTASVEIEEEEKRIGEEEIKISEKIEANQKLIDSLLDRKKKMIPGIDKGILNKFEKIVSNKDGMGIAKIIDGSCEGCHMAVPPQLISKVRQKKKLIPCLNCSRFLYIDSN